jgi:DNA-binding transcriptional ArsR family regulator
VVAERAPSSSDRRRGLTERFAADDCEAEPPALERIIEYGEGQSRSTMLLAQKSHLTTVELGSLLIDLTVVEQGLLDAMAADRIAHEQIAERIRRSHKLGLVVVERLVHGQPVYTGLSRGAVRRPLEALRDAGIIYSAGRADWRFSSPLVRRDLQAIAPFE